MQTLFLFLFLQVVLEYPKVARVYFRYLRCLFVHHLGKVGAPVFWDLIAVINSTVATGSTDPAI